MNTGCAQRAYVPAGSIDASGASKLDVWDTCNGSTGRAQELQPRARVLAAPTL